MIPNLIAIIEGMKAAKRLYKIIDQEPTISNDKGRGLKKDKIEGYI